MQSEEPGWPANALYPVADLNPTGVRLPFSQRLISTATNSWVGRSVSVSEMAPSIRRA